MNEYSVQLRITNFRDGLEEHAVTDGLGPFVLNLINLEAGSDVRLKKPITHEMFLKIADKGTSDKFINLVTQVKLFRIRSLMEYQKQLALAERLIGVLEEKY